MPSTMGARRDPDEAHSLVADGPGLGPRRLCFVDCPGCLALARPAAACAYGAAACAEAADLPQEAACREGTAKRTGPWSVRPGVWPERWVCHAASTFPLVLGAATATATECSRPRRKRSDADAPMEPADAPHTGDGDGDGGGDGHRLRRASTLAAACARSQLSRRDDALTVWQTAVSRRSAARGTLHGRD
jgi:hypothetical protein